MDLSTRKYIHNTKPKIELPGYAGGFFGWFKNFFSKKGSTNTQAPSGKSEEQPGGGDVNGGYSAYKNIDSTDAMQGAIGGLGSVFNILNSSKPAVTTNQLVNSTSSHYENINGIQTLQYGPVDTSAAENISPTQDALMGGALMASSMASLGPAGMAVGFGVGTLLGGLGSASKRRETERRIAKAQEINRNRNIDNVDRSKSKAAQIAQAEEYGDSLQQSLFHRFAGGKQPDVNPMTGMTYNKYLVNTSDGPQVRELNAWVSDGEVIQSKNGSMYKVGEGKLARYANGKDTERAFIRPGDTIYSNMLRNPDTGNTFAEDAPMYKQMGMLPRLQMNLLMAQNNMNKYCKGKLPGYWPGKVGQYINKIGLNIKSVAPGIASAAPEIMGLIGAYQQYKEASEPWYTPDVSANNPYESMIPKLLSLLPDYYPIWQQHREIEGRGRSAIALSGGLDAGQKTLAYANLYNNTLQNNENALFNWQNARNQQLAKGYEIAINEGSRSADRKQAANISNRNNINEVSNANKRGKGSALLNAYNMAASIILNNFKRQQFNWMKSQYAQDAAAEKAARDNANAIPSVKMPTRSQLKKSTISAPKNIYDDYYTYSNFNKRINDFGNELSYYMSNTINPKSLQGANYLSFLSPDSLYAMQMPNINKIYK